MKMFSKPQISVTSRIEYAADECPVVRHMPALAYLVTGTRCTGMPGSSCVITPSTGQKRNVPFWVTSYYSLLHIT